MPAIGSSSCSIPDKTVQAEAIRWWRLFKGDPKMIAILVKHTPELLKQIPGHSRGTWPWF